MIKKRILVIIGLVWGVCVAVVVLAIFPPSGEIIVDAFPIVRVRGYISDKNIGSADNFKNGKVIIEVQLKSRGISEDLLKSVLDSGTPMQMTISGHNKTWSVPTINLRENSGKTEANYGENIECDGVVQGPSGWGDNLYVKISVPTNLSGDIEEEEITYINIWPTTDVVSAVNGTIFPANFDSAAVNDWWDNKDIIDIIITGKNYSLSLTSSSGAYLIGTEIDE